MKIKYDMTGVKEGDFEPPQPGIYKMKIDLAEYRSEKNDIHVRFQVVGGEYDGSWVHSYFPIANDHPFARRTAQLFKVLGIKVKGTVDTDTLLGKTLAVQVTGEEWQDQYQARYKQAMSLDALKVTGPSDEDDDDDEDEDDTDEDESDEDVVEVDIDAMDRSELKQFIADESLGIKVTKSMSDEDIRVAIRAAVDEDEEDEPEDDDEEEEAPPKRRGSRASKPEDESEEEDEDEDESEDESDEDDDYNNWSVEELREELTSRQLSKDGRKTALVDRLVNDDKKASKRKARK